MQPGVKITFWGAGPPRSAQSFSRTSSAVSYTHLDVYKRQKVTRSALENAASVAGVLLTTESLVTDKPEPPAPAAPAAPDMGGMY